MLQKAATIYDAGDDRGSGEAANMAKYAAAEVAVRAIDQAVQTHGGNGLASEYGLGAMLGSIRLGRIAPSAGKCCSTSSPRRASGCRSPPDVTEPSGASAGAQPGNASGAARRRHHVARRARLGRRDGGRRRRACRRLPRGRAASLPDARGAVHGRHRRVDDGVDRRHPPPARRAAGTARPDPCRGRAGRRRVHRAAVPSRPRAVGRRRRRSAATPADRPVRAAHRREAHRVVVELLDADESRPGVREAIQRPSTSPAVRPRHALSDDRRRREAIVAYWVTTLEPHPSHPVFRDDGVSRDDTPRTKHSVSSKHSDEGVNLRR